MKKLTTRTLLILIAVIDVLLGGILIYTKLADKKGPEDRQVSESSIRRICELATLDCFYHNVTEWSDQGDFFRAGKKMWIEYDGKVRVGIKADQVKKSGPDKDGVYTITIPSAVILGKDLDEESIYEIDSEAPLWGFFPIYGTVSTEERKEALAKAQTDMETSAANNLVILGEAQDRAKKIIENNIVKAGEAIGKSYKVKFVEASENDQKMKEETPPEGENNNTSSDGEN